MWTGDTILSKVVNFLITNPQLYPVIKYGAKEVIKRSAEKAGVRWTQRAKELEQTPEVYKIKEELEDLGVHYPFYYKQPFHAYDEGNLSWLAAFEVEPASYAMAIRTFKTEVLTPQQAMDKLRLSINSHIQEYRQQHSLGEVQQVLDAGCSIGISTAYMARLFPSASITGFDLSAYMLAVAELLERQYWEQHTQGGQAPTRQRIAYKHGLLEQSGYPDQSFDVVTLHFVIHECPEKALQDIVAEARRLLRPGGMVAFVDNNPKSKIIQNLPPVIFTLMKSTEPWSDQYYSFDMEAAMRAVGFLDVVTTEPDPRHRAIMGRVPA